MKWAEMVLGFRGYASMAEARRANKYLVYKCERCGKLLKANEFLVCQHYTDAPRRGEILLVPWCVSCRKAWHELYMARKKAEREARDAAPAFDSALYWERRRLEELYEWS